MALNKTAMASAIVDSLVANGKLSGLSAGDITQMKSDMEAWCEGFITYFTANAQVNTTVSVASVSGVTPGSGSSGPGTGTGTGTIT